MTGLLNSYNGADRTFTSNQSILQNTIFIIVMYSIQRFFFCNKTNKIANYKFNQIFDKASVRPLFSPLPSSCGFKIYNHGLKEVMHPTKATWFF